MNRTSSLALLAFTCLVSASAAHAQYTTLDDPLGTKGTYAQGISGGNIVGYYTDSSGSNHGFEYNGSTYTTLDDPSGAKGTIAYGISGGNIVGTYIDSSNNSHGFEYNGSTYTTLTDPKGKVTVTGARGISGSSIIGPGYKYDGTTFSTFYPAPIFDTRGSTANGIDGSNIVGSYFTGTYITHGFKYDGTAYTTLDDPLATSFSGTSAQGISGSLIVGYYTTTGSGFMSLGNVHGFEYDGTTYTTLDNPSATNGTYAEGIDSNTIVGSSGNGSGNTVVGYYSDSNGSHGFKYTPAATPEPGAIVLLVGLSVSGAGFLARRRRSARP